MRRAFLAYRVRGRSIVLPQDGSLLAVTYDDALPTPERRPIEQACLRGARSLRYEVPAQRLTLLKLASPPAAGEGLEVVQRLNAVAEVELSQPVHVYGALRVAVGDRVVLRMREGAAAAAEAALLRRGLQVVERSGDTWICRTPAGEDPAAVAALLDGAPWAVYAEPDLISVGRHPERVAPGLLPLSALEAPTALQPALRQVNAAAGWERLGGRLAVRVAVLDDGMDLQHPALREAIVNSYDALTDSGLLASNAWDTHGTACAALAIGRDDAGAFRGVAAGAALLAVRIASSPGPGQPWVTSTSAIRRGLDWAVAAGADVISNSWGGSAPSNLVVDAIQRATTQGRGGRGCVLAFAAGNHGAEVVFPANLEGVLTVSGVNLRDEFKTAASSDGEPWWGSCWGPEVDIAAPAVSLRTADTVSTGGRSPGDYVDGFNGTSAATPIVAGAAALLLALRPTLGRDEVHALLCESAAKVGASPYAGGRNDQLGCGRLDIAAALARADAPAAGDGQLAGPVPQAGWEGEVRRLAAGVPVFVLDAAGTPLLLQAGLPDAATTLRAAQEADIAAFGPVEGRRVGLTARASEGQVLWGATVQGAAPGGRARVDPAAGEVLLPDPASDLFGGG